MYFKIQKDQDCALNLPNPGWSAYLLLIYEKTSEIPQSPKSKRMMPVATMHY